MRAAGTATLAARLARPALAPDPATLGDEKKHHCDELYVIEKVWPGTKAVGTALNAVDNGRRLELRRSR